ncbi:DNA-directed RNA polymerase III subunit RPC4 [Striga asiatica]|uniref:DNA-directed RNA polymerase III subunit RPC4 n=1 Tax=Striga asiatica TaxID=4170 RepID=A0A5A7QMZ1_STRAF|nr:DNA-directed RNA polymerase III subunit RPC4 [Striga asiatica]
MDPDPPPSAPRKVKFAPKAPARRTPKPPAAKIVAEDDDGDDEAARQRLSRRINENLSRRNAKAENKSSDQVTFSLNAPSTILRTYGKQYLKSDLADPETLDSTSDAAKTKKETPDDMQKLVRSISTSGQGFSENYVDFSNSALAVKTKREYKEPWDYHHTYYPTTLPWRKPYSGNPEILDKAEFEDAPEYDENTDLDDTPGMLLFKFPSNLPLDNSRPPRSSKGKEIAGSSVTQEREHSSKKGCKLEELPEGLMGKMLVYKSGAVKLKLGDVLYDVSPGSDCSFAQSVMTINTANHECCELGELSKRAVVTPDIDSLLDNVIDLG